MRFSDRYKYTTPLFVLKKEMLEDGLLKSLCTCFDTLERKLYDYDRMRSPYVRWDSYTLMEEEIWSMFLNERKRDFWPSENSHMIVATKYLLDVSNVWYDKLNMLEFCVRYLKETKQNDFFFQEVVNSFIDSVNQTFKRLDYVYRIVGTDVVEITDDEEIKEIEEALKTSLSVKTHLSNALRHLGHQPAPDYRNSIKESISAVEVICRDITGESTLGDALKSLEKKGVSIPKMLQISFEKLYAYTNDKRTGIRHALIENTEVPSFEEAKFMIVACSAFVNYIEGKRKG